jgi:hypothetical protein
LQTSQPRRPALRLRGFPRTAGGHAKGLQWPTLDGLRRSRRRWLAARRLINRVCHPIVAKPGKTSRSQ